MACVSYIFLTLLKPEMLHSNVEWKYLTTHTSQQKTGYELQTNNAKPLPIIPKYHALLHISFTTSGMEKSSV